MAASGDVQIVWNANGFGGDIAMSAGDLLSGNDIQTAVLISLFTDKVAPAGYKHTDGTTDRRGWWADTYTGDPIGSLLWTYMRAKRTTETMNNIVDEVKKSLAWMLTDGVATSVAVRAQWLNQWGLALAVTIVTPPPESQPVLLNFSVSPPAAPVFLSDSGVVYLANPTTFPTSSAGLDPGDLYLTDTALAITTGVVYDPTQAPLYFTSPWQDVLQRGGAAMPTTAPSPGSGQLWNNGLLVCTA